MGKIEINIEVVNNEDVIMSKFIPDSRTRSIFFNEGPRRYWSYYPLSS